MGGVGGNCWTSGVDPGPPTPQAIGEAPDLLFTTSLVVLWAAGGTAAASVPSSVPFQKAPLADVGVDGTSSISSRKRTEWVCRVSAVGGCGLSGVWPQRQVPPEPLLVKRGLYCSLYA